MTSYTPTAVQTAAGVRDKAIQGFVGDLADTSQLNKRISALNSIGGVKQVSTLTVSGATNAKTYTIIVQGISVSYLADGTATIAEICAGFEAAIKADPAVGAMVSVTSTATTVVLTARNFGLTFTVSEDDAQLSWAATTAAATAAVIPFGRLLIGGAFGALSGIRSGGLPSSLVAQADTLDYTYNATSTWEVTVEYGGLKYSGAVVQATSKAASTNAMLAELNAALPANSVIASNVGDALVLTAEIAGGSFRTSYAMSDLATTLPSLSSTRSTSTSIDDALLGLSKRVLNVQSRTIGETASGYNPNDVMEVLAGGRLFVARDTSETPALGGTVYVETSGSDAGLLFTAASSTRCPVAALEWERSLSDDLAIVTIAA